MHNPLLETHSIARELINDSDARHFLDIISIQSWLNDAGQNDFLIKEGTMANKLTFLANQILYAESENRNASHNPTKTSKHYRISKCRTDSLRQKLANEILQECFITKRVECDDDVRLGIGGFLPINSELRLEKKIFFVIGSPASGKSTVSNYFADLTGAFMLDSDLVKRKLPEYSIPICGPTIVHKESVDIITVALKTACSLGANIVYQLVGAEYQEWVYDSNLSTHVDKGFRTMVAELRDTYQYEVTIVLPELDRVKATRRALRRFVETNRYVPLTKILDDYSNNAIRTFYKMMCFEPNYGYIVLDTDLPKDHPKRYVLLYNNDKAKQYCQKL